MPPKQIRPIPEEISKALEDRGINLETTKKYKVEYIQGPENPFVHSYPYTKNGKHVGNKLRGRHQKSFVWEGNAKDVDLFGQSLFPAGGRFVTITEGECDAMAVHQMNGGFPVVSVRSAATAVTDIRNNFEYLNAFDEIVVCFDNDEPGQEAALRVAEILPYGKVRILTLKEHKDPNDYLQAQKAKPFVKEWWSAPLFTPAGLKLGKELWDAVINPPQFETTPYPFEGLDKKTYGMRLSEFVVVNAPPKVGKSTILGEITHHLLTTTKEAKVGLMRLEESNRDTALNLMSIEANKRLHLPDVWEECGEEEIKKYFDAVVNTERVVMWDHFGSNSIHAVLDKMRHMHALGCKYIILDHLSIIVSDQSGDERKQLDELATKIKTLCMELNVCVLAVVHQNRSGEIRGTQGIEQLANIVIKLERDKLAESDFIRNVMKVTVTENRFCGETGLACYLFYDLETGRLKELTEEEYLKGVATGEAPWTI
jgi:twinkle protein